MNQNTLNNEMEIAEEHSEISEKRGLNWAIISLSLIALTIFLTAIIVVFSPDSFFNFINKNSETPGSPVEQRESR